MRGQYQLIGSLFGPIFPGPVLKRALVTASDAFYWPVKTVLAGPTGFDVDMFDLPVWTKRGCK